MSKRPMSKKDRFDPHTIRAFHSAGLPEVFAVRQASDAHEILLYDEIGYDGVRAKDLAQVLSKISPTDKVRVRINSPGGSAFDGIAMYSMLRNRQGEVETVVDGLAASAASVVAMAGNTVSMHETASMMVHNSHGVVVGNKHDLVTMSKHLEEMDGKMQRIYADKTGKSPTDIAALMDAETWLSSSSAKMGGFIDTVIEAPTRNTANALDNTEIMAVGMKLHPTDRCRYALPKYATAQYDPDGDGDDDVAEAIAYVQAAIGNCADAIEALNGTMAEDTSEDDTMASIADMEREIAELTAEFDATMDTIAAHEEKMQLERNIRLRRLRIVEATN